MILTNFYFWSTQCWLVTSWSIWPKMTLQVLQCSNGLHHVNLDVTAAPWKMVNVFEIFGVQHINWKRTKYSIYTLLEMKYFVTIDISASHTLKILMAPYFSWPIVTQKYFVTNLKIFRDEILISSTNLNILLYSVMNFVFPH